jgi:pimeloyl-ACP methyl ester carboxylesterase
MIRHRVVLAMLILLVTFCYAEHPSLPSSFQSKTIHSPEGADIYVRWGGTGAVVVLLHGYAENSDSWAPLASDLMKDHTVVVPDLRGIGRSSKPEGGYDKKTEAKDIRAVVTTLGFDKTSVVAHDIGNMVAYAYTTMYPDKVDRLVVMDAPIPGIEPWNTILLNPGVWHFNFHGPDAERLVAGRERIYFDRIWNDFTGDPSQPDEATRKFLHRHLRTTRRHAGWLCAVHGILHRCGRQQDLRAGETDDARLDCRRGEVVRSLAGSHHAPRGD